MPTRNATPTSPSTKPEIRRAQAVISHDSQDDRRHDRNDGDDQPSGRAVEASLGVSEQPPRSNDLDRGVDQQDLPVRQQRLERTCPDSYRKQQQSTKRGPAERDNQRIKISYSDPDEEVMMQHTLRVAKSSHPRRVTTQHPTSAFPGTSGPLRGMGARVGSNQRDVLVSNAEWLSGGAVITSNVRRRAAPDRE